MLRLVATVVVAVIGVAISGVLNGTSPSLAHEHRAVGNYEFVVGWLTEPALAYEPNGLSLRITFFPNGVPEAESEEAEAEGQPVEGLEQTLQAEIIAGGGAQTKELTLEPAFNDPGHYASTIIPSAPGDYTFRVFGDLEGQQIDEEFTSGPETFSVIEDVGELQFPERLPSNADLSEQIANLDTGGDSDTATILAVIGIIVGAVGIGVGGYALAARRSA